MYTYNAKIIDVYDGDTVTAEIDLGFKISFKIKIRLEGINTPEIKGETKHDGLIAKERVVELVLGKEVIIKTYKHGTEKYGRYLADIFHKDEARSINQILLDEGLAKPYK